MARAEAVGKSEQESNNNNRHDAVVESRDRLAAVVFLLVFRRGDFLAIMMVCSCWLGVTIPGMTMTRDGGERLRERERRLLLLLMMSVTQ